MLESRESMQISRSLVIPGDNERETSVAGVTGTVLPDKSLSISMLFSDVETARENRQVVVDALSSFAESVRQLARDNGLPV